MFGVNDGLVSTMGFVAGATGSLMQGHLVLLAGIAYAGLISGDVIAVNLLNGTILSSVNIGSAVQDVALEGNRSYRCMRLALRMQRQVAGPG